MENRDGKNIEMEVWNEEKENVSNEGRRRSRGRRRKKNTKMDDWSEGEGHITETIRIIIATLSSAMPFLLI